MKFLRVSVCGNRDRIPDMHIRELVLIHVRQYPNRSHVRDREALRHACLNHLARCAKALHDLAFKRRNDGNLRGSGILN